MKKSKLVRVGFTFTLKRLEMLRTVLYISYNFKWSKHQNPDSDAISIRITHWLIIRGVHDNQYIFKMYFLSTIKLNHHHFD